MPQYWVYKDPPTGRTTIHDEFCGFCNHGKGVNRLLKYDSELWWDGPYGSLDAALQEAQGHGHRVRIHSCCDRISKSEKSQPYRRFELDDVDETKLTLNDLFHRRMLQIYVLLRDETGYSAKRFLGAVRRHGGVEYAKQALRRPVQAQAGFQVLIDEGRLDISFEQLVSDPQFESLFSPTEIAEAKRRLRSA